MLMGALGAIVPFFFLHWNEKITGFMAFGLATAGLFIGSMIRVEPTANVRFANAATEKQ